ncbi:MAG: TonB-dependent receptor [Burkholderiales bacterium PBB5]|nr:MAG: TonB-dependent receptor [Burkholderiales bacterium PBB5]
MNCRTPGPLARHARPTARTPVRPPTLRPSLLALALALPGSLALAQSATPAAAPTPDKAELGEVTIVGSRAKGRTVFDSAAPVDRYSSRDVDQALAATGELGAALQALSPSINQPRVSAAGSADSVRVVQLRGLAPDQVLVLVNGKRRHTNAVLDLEGIFQGTVPVDLNAIPANAIERIEVLRDGAGAQYGSDAVAGVINIVLKGGGTGGSGSVNFGAHHSKFAPTGRTLTDGQTLQLAADQGLSFGNGGVLRFGAELQRKAGTNRAGRSDAGWTSASSSDADLALDNQVLFKSGDPQVHGGSVFVNTTVPVATDVQAYAFATLHRRSTEGAAFFRYPDDPNNVRAIYPNGYRPVTTGEVTDLAVVAGARIGLADWVLDASLRQAGNRYEQGVKHSLNASLGAASPTAFDLATLRSGQTSANLDASRAISLGGGSALNLAAGGEWLHETYRSSAGDAASYAAGPFSSAPPGAQAGPGLRPSDAVSLSRDIKSLYADLEYELNRDWLLATALRVADYSDAGSSSTGKLAARYKLTPQWLLRGSVSNSFRAPALAQTGFRFATLNFNADGTALQNNVLVPATDPLAQAFGALPLKPETSRHLSLGTAWRPAAGTTVSVDAYRVTVKDRITRTSDLYLPTTGSSDAPEAALARALRVRTAATTGTTPVASGDVQSVAFLTNALDTTTTGLDVSASHELAMAGGTLTLNTALNLNRTRIDHVRQGSDALAAIDPTLTLIGPDALLRVSHGTPRSKLMLGADWQVGPWGLNLRATRFGSVWAYSFDSSAPVIDGAPAQRLGNTWVVDAEVQFRPLPAMTLALGANNLFNRYPSRTLADSTYGGAFPYNFTDPTGINGAYYYARASWRW